MWIERHVGADIEVLYLTDNNMYSDRGRLMEVGDGWIELHKDHGKKSAQIMLIPNTAIRLIKVHAPAPEPENLLLRPAQE